MAQPIVTNKERYERLPEFIEFMKKFSFPSEIPLILDPKDKTIQVHAFNGLYETELRQWLFQMGVFQSEKTYLQFGETTVYYRVVIMKRVGPGERERLLIFDAKQDKPRRVCFKPDGAQVARDVWLPVPRQSFGGNRTQYMP
jgi:hypothetical protein